MQKAININKLSTFDGDDELGDIQEILKNTDLLQTILQ